MILPTLDYLNKNRDAGLEFRSRRHSQWTDNYLLYRDKVIVNRLTQRQSANVPLMKETLRTMLTRVDDLTQLRFQSRDNNDQQDLCMNEYWAQAMVRRQKLELVDIVDKKQQMLYGRGNLILNIADGFPTVTPVDPQDVIFDRYMDPWNVETAEYVILTGIYRRLETLEGNPIYDKEALRNLRTFMGTREGLVKADANTAAAIEKNERLTKLGVPDMENPQIGYTLVELRQHFDKRWNPQTREMDVILSVVADGSIVLMQHPLRDLLGVNFYPIVTWADDIERTDPYSDGWGDVVRPLNQIANIYISQDIEARVLATFGMHFYDSTAQEGFMPMGYSPEPFGFYPFPGDPNKVLKEVNIRPLADMSSAISFITGIVERATASSAIEKGTNEGVKKTLGEIELLAAKSEERITSITKYSRIAWKELGEKFSTLVNNNTGKLREVELFKKNGKNKYYPKRLKPAEMRSMKGYECEVTTVAEKEKTDIDGIRKLKIISSDFPTNVPLQKILKRRELEFAGLNADDMREVMDYEEKNPQPIPLQPAGQPAQSIPQLATANA